LREALENEIHALATDKQMAGATLTAWNYQEYEVQLDDCFGPFSAAMLHAKLYIPGFIPQSGKRA